MDQAPSVRYPVGRTRFSGMLAGGLALVGAAGVSYWMAQSDAPGWRHAFAAAATLLVDLVALNGWLRSPQGMLRWDGAEWTGPGIEGAGAMEVAIDLQGLLLVRWHGDILTRWLWLERRRNPAQWADLRRAVYSRARPHASFATKPPPATP